MFEVPRGDEDAFRVNLEKEMLARGLREFKDDFRIECTDGELEISFLNDTSACGPGNNICYYNSDDDLRYSTSGAFVRDENGQLYILSSCHGSSASNFFLFVSSDKSLTPKRYKLTCAAVVYQKDPLLDAVLLRVNEEELLCDPHVRQPFKNSALCGVYCGSMGRLYGDKRTLVLKYGSKTELTRGELCLYEFENHHECISNALVIKPVSDKEPFCADGDSGAVIYKEEPHTHVQKSRGYCLHEGIALLCAGIRAKNSESVWGLACRLDDVLIHFQQQLWVELTVLPFDH